MAHALQGITGVPRGQTFNLTYSVYDQTYTPTGVITAGTAITLPSSGTYQGSELDLELNGISLVPTTDYSFVGTAPRTQFTLTFNIDTNDRLRIRVPTVS